jgi:hypothetical protein
LRDLICPRWHWMQPDQPNHAIRPSRTTSHIRTWTTSGHSGPHRSDVAITIGTTLMQYPISVQSEPSTCPFVLYELSTHEVRSTMACELRRLYLDSTLLLLFLAALSRVLKTYRPSLCFSCGGFTAISHVSFFFHDAPQGPQDSYMILKLPLS